MNRMLICLIASAALTHCTSSDDGDSQSSTGGMAAENGLSQLGGPAGANAADGSAPEGTDWCARLGATETERQETVDQIVVQYFESHSGFCETGALASLIDAQFDAWIQYLTDYTFLLAGCDPNFGTVAGGINVFGPANTAFVGVARPPLSEREAELLVDFYLEAFASALNLTDSERAMVRAHLEEEASQEVVASAPGSLSTCEDADADGGASGTGGPALDVDGGLSAPSGD
jgi:hypothetical protein